MKWADVDFEKKMLTVPKSKTGEPRYIPLSDYAIERLSSLYSESPWVFTLSNGKPLKDPRESFDKGRELAGLGWVRGLHDLRHFRATQWLMRGVDIYTVKDYLGHKRIETTQRYLHFVPGHAEESVRTAQLAEQVELGKMATESGRHMGDTTLNQVAVQAGVAVTY